jgi:hypothetical protein
MSMCLKMLTSTYKIATTSRRLLFSKFKIPYRARQSRRYESRKSMYNQRKCFLKFFEVVTELFSLPVERLPPNGVSFSYVSHRDRAAHGKLFL